jgi:anti-repressor protein
LGSGRHFADWVKDRIEKYAFVEGRDYVTVIISQTGEKGRPRIEYYATLTMGKELAMVENNDRGRMFGGLRFEPGRISAQ